MILIGGRGGQNGFLKIPQGYSRQAYQVTGPKYCPILLWLNLDFINNEF